MDIKAEDFPLYQLLVKLGEPGVEMAIADFKKACTGGDEDKYYFALGIQTIATIPNCVPGQTDAMNQKTLQTCLAVFEDVASRGHEGAALMVADFRARGLGCSGSSPKKADSFKPK